MAVMGVDNTDIAYFLMKEANWNLEVAVYDIQNAINNFFGEV